MFMTGSSSHSPRDLLNTNTNMLNTNMVCTLWPQCYHVMLLLQLLLTLPVCADSSGRA